MKTNRNTFATGLSICTLALLGFTNTTFAQVKSDSTFISQIDSVSIQFQKPDSTNEVEIKNAILNKVAIKSSLLDRYQYLVAQNPINQDSVVLIKTEIASIDAEILYLNKILDGNINEEDTTTIDNDFSNYHQALSVYEEQKTILFKKYNELVSVTPIDMDAVAQVKTSIYLVQDKIDFLKKALNGDIVDVELDSSWTVNDDSTIFVQNDKMIALEKEKLQLLEKYAQLINQDTVDYNLITEIKKKIEVINNQLMSTSDTLYFIGNNDINIYKEQDSLLVNIVQVSIYDNELDELYKKYNALLGDTVVDVNALIAIKEKILLLEDKISKIDSSKTNNNLVDVTFWNDKVKTDTVIDNKVRFTWTIDNVSDQYSFQIAKDSLFNDLVINQDSLINAYFEFDIQQLIALKSDSSAQRFARVAQAAGNIVYWRVGVKDNSNNIVWDAPTSLDIEKVTAIEPFEAINISVYPNPVVESFVIEGVNNLTAVNVYNSVGNLVKQFSPQVNYSLTGLNSGIYFIEVVNAGATSRTRITLR